MQPCLSAYPLIPAVWQQLDTWLSAVTDSEALPPPAALGFSHSEGDHYQLQAGRLQVHCRHARQSQLAKLHLEATVIGEGFAYLHAMLFPEPTSGLPLVGVDVNASPRQASLAVLHVYPGVDGLPKDYPQAVAGLDVDFSKYRPLPAWGDIFQEGICCLIQPQDSSDGERYLALVDAVLVAHRVVLARQPTVSDPLANRTRQHYYCQQKRRNDRGRKVLATHLGVERADQYVDDFLWPLL